MSLAAIASLNTWKLSMKTNKTDVTCFGDTNKVYVPGLPDISGSFGGFWNSSALELFTAAQDGSSPGLLELTPNDSADEQDFNFSGLGYLDADIDVSLDVPKVSGTFVAAGPWTLAT